MSMQKKRMSILIVEDNDGLRKLLSYYLSRELDCEVYEAPSTARAKAIYDQQSQKHGEATQTPFNGFLIDLELENKPAPAAPRSRCLRG